MAKEDVFTYSFHGPCIMLSLFDTLITSTILYEVQNWGPNLDRRCRSGGISNECRSMERPLISMISRMIQNKVSKTHDIIRTETAAPLMVIETLAR